MTHGFLLGKFLPPHFGHVTLAQTALALTDRLTVLVCSLPGDPIPGALRHAWMTELLPQARVLHHDAPIPQTPQEHPEFWAIWRQAVRALVPEPITQVFGSETYVPRLASELGAEPVVIDPDRRAIPTSGTAIRANPAGEWRWLPAPVRRHYQRRVTVFGAESTGKSTLAADLARHFGDIHVPEHGRVFELYRPIGPYRPGELAELAQRHIAHRATLAPLAGPVLIEDTDAVTTAVWARMMDQPDPVLEQAPLADLYLVTDPDVPFVQDGIRYFDGDARARFHQIGLDLLAARGAKTVLLRGDWDQRLAQAVEAVNRLKGPDVHSGRA